MKYRLILVIAIASTTTCVFASAQESASPAEEQPSISPDRKWAYKCVEYNGECWSQIVKAGTTQVVVDLTDAPDGAGATNPEILWAPDSKRFAFNYSPVQRHHTGLHRALETVAFYQLRGDKWEALRSLEDETTQSLAKGHVPKNAYPRHCDPEVDTFKLRNWTDANTAILYAACYQRNSGDLGSRFLFTLKFDEAGNWKIVKAHQMSKKEFEEEEAGEDVSGSGQTTKQAGLSADVSFRDADRHLNEVYNALRARLSPPERDRLRKEQLAWINRRNAAAQVAKGNAEGNPTHAGDGDVTKMTLARAAELEKRLKKAK